MMPSAGWLLFDQGERRQTWSSEAAQWREGTQCSCAVREYLDAIDIAHPVADDSPEQAPDIDNASPAHLPDRPGCAVVRSTGRPRVLHLLTNYLIDLSTGIILDVKATPAHRTPEVDATRTMVDRVEKRFGVKP